MPARGGQACASSSCWDFCWRSALTLANRQANRARSTPPGTFSVFVILYDQQSPQFNHGRWQYRYWYSPDVNHVVKFEYRPLRGDLPPNYPKNWELTAYTSPSAQPSRTGPEAAAARPV